MPPPASSPPGSRARDRADLHAAANLLERALAVGIGDPRERARVQVELGIAISDPGRFAEVDAVLTEALEAATRLGDGTLRRSRSFIAPGDE